MDVNRQYKNQIIAILSLFETEHCNEDIQCHETNGSDYESL